MNDNWRRLYRLQAYTIHNDITRFSKFAIFVILFECVNQYYTLLDNFYWDENSMRSVFQDKRIFQSVRYEREREIAKCFELKG